MSRNGRLLTAAVALGIVLGLLFAGYVAPAVMPSIIPPTTALPEATQAPTRMIAPAMTAVTTPSTGAAGQIRIAIGSDPITLDPQAADDVSERICNDNIYETLLTRDPDMRIVPLLAESYKQVDATTWEFKIRSGVKFHNGEPFDAEAAAFSVNRIVDEKFNSELRSSFETIREARTVNASTVQVVTTGPDPILPARMCWLKMVPPKYANKKEFGEKPMGTGPYKFVEWARGSRVVLTANRYYWGLKPQIADVMILVRKEPTARLSALKAGEVDLICDLLPEQVSQVPKVVREKGLEFPFFRINNKVEKLKDPRVRQAMNYAVDKEALINAIYGGHATLAEGQIIGPAHFGYNPNVKAYPYDLEKAKALLREANAVGTEIHLVGESGRWFGDKEIVEAVAEMLRKASFEVDVDIQEWQGYLDRLFATDNQPDLIFVSTDNQLLDADRTLSAYYLSTGRVSSYLNPQVDRLINEARTETDITKREAMYHEAIQISRDDPPHIFLVNVDNVFGLSKRIDWKPPLDGRILVEDMRVIQPWNTWSQWGR